MVCMPQRKVRVLRSVRLKLTECLNCPVHVDSSLLLSALIFFWTFFFPPFLSLFHHHCPYLDLVHRDLAARNVLLDIAVDQTFCCKIADLGLTRVVEEIGVYSAAGPCKLPVRWTAPEVNRRGGEGMIDGGKGKKYVTKEKNKNSHSSIC